MNNIDNIIWRIVDFMILVAVLGMVLIIGLQVVSRTFGQSITWTEELSRFLFIWTIWLGLSSGFRNGQHPSITSLVELTSGNVRKFLEFLPVVATSILFITVGWFGFLLLKQQIAFGEKSAILQIGMWITTLPIVLGSTLSVLGILSKAFVQSSHDVNNDDINPGNVKSGDLLKGNLTNDE